MQIGGEALGEAIDPFRPVGSVDEDHDLYSMGLDLLKSL